MLYSNNIALALLLVWSTAAFAQEPELSVEVDRQQVYLGESIIYNVTVNHIENPSAPQLDGFDDFVVELQGQQSLDSQKITIINGRRSEIIRRGMLYQYKLTANRAGQIAIPAPTADANGSTIRGRSIPLTVIAPQEQEIVILESSVDRESVYPLQPFTVSLTMAVKQLPGEYASRSPLSVQSGDPAKLSVSWLTDEELPAGLEPKQSWREILEPIVSGSSRRQSDGIQINDIGSQSAFSLFERSRKTVFLPPATRTTRSTIDGTDAGYVEYRLQRTFLPQKLGTFRFEAATVKGTFGTGETDQGLSGENIYAVSQPLTVTVKDVPLQGRPETYIGAIGMFVVTADVVPTTASVGTPMTLTLTVAGEGTLADLRPPNIDGLPGMADHFRTYDATEKPISNGRVFTYSLRALSEEVTELPAIPVAYFDVEKEAYVSLETPAIPLTITAAQQLSAADIMASEPAVAAGNALAVSEAGLFANHTSLQTLRATNISLKQWITVWIMLIAGYLAISFGIQRRQRLQADPALMRRRLACGRAVESLKAIRQTAGTDKHVSAESLSKVVAGLIADFTGTAEAGMTSVDAAAALEQFAVDEDVRRRVTELMDHGDAARFGAAASTASTGASTITQDCERLIADLSRELDKRC